MLYTFETLMSAKRAINDKFQGSVATYSVTAPESSTSRRGAKKSFRGHVASVEPEMPKAWSSRRRMRRRGGEWGGDIPLPSPLGGLGERRRLPQRGPGRVPSKNDFTAFCIRVPERLSLQRLLKINLVSSRPLIEKNGFTQWIGSDPLRQPRRL